jgi:hypothetical protein
MQVGYKTSAGTTRNYTNWFMELMVQECLASKSVSLKRVKIHSTFVFLRALKQLEQT